MADDINEQQQNQASNQSKMAGRASATEREPNTSEKFSFWIGPNERLNPFDIVTAEHLEGSKTYGLVTTIRHLTDAASHLSNFISNDFGELTAEVNTPRTGTNVAEATVLSNDKEIYMPVQNEADISFADEDGIHKALGIDAMKEKEEREGRKIRIPAGIIKLSNNTEAVSYFDSDYILGEEAGHVNVSGISGLATKTSYIMFLIQSLLQSLENRKIATIILNVKFDDLLHIHEPDDLSEEQKGMWKRLGLEPKPFPEDKVRYLLPWGKNTNSSGRPNTFAANPPAHMPYAYDFRSSASKLDLLLSSVPDNWGTLGDLVGLIKNGIEENLGIWREVNTWNDLLTKKPLVEENIPQEYGGVKKDSVRRFIRIMRTLITNRQSGIFVPQLASRMVSLDKEIAKIQAGYTYVIDIAKLTDAEKTLVFGDVLRTIFELYSGESAFSDNAQSDLPEKVIIFVDELNKYAPAHGNTPIVDQVLDIAERGRSFGLILFSAQQFLSAVHPRVTGNTETKVFGRTSSSELSESAYRFLNPDIKTHLTRLNKGEMILSHPLYQQPIKVVFPKPGYKQRR